MKRTLIYRGLLLLCLGACQAMQNTDIVTVSPTASPHAVMPVPSATPSPDLPPALTATSDWAQFQVTMSALRTEVAQAANTVTPFVAPTTYVPTNPVKQPLIIYGPDSRTRDSLEFLMRGPFFFFPTILLYSDGQLILGDIHQNLRETKLSQAEIDRLMTDLKQHGIYQLGDVYTCKDSCRPGANSLNILFVDGEEEKQVYFDPSRSYDFTPAMQAIVTYMNHLSFQALAPYQPDRLLASIHRGKVFPNQADSDAIPWPEGVTSPLFRSTDGVLYLEGDEAARVYRAANGAGFEVFSFEGEEYSVFLRPMFPHECGSWRFTGASEASSQEFFYCDDWDTE